MYKMKADGVVFYDPSSDDMALQVLSPKATWELNKPGSLEFTLLPGNVLYDGMNKMKTVITLEQDDEIIFCGRVLETTTDLYNQKEVYCEGELGFLIDSLQKPYTFSGHPSDLFKQLLSVHNAQMEEYKRFEPGIITAIPEDEASYVDGSSISDTLAEIQSLLLDEHGGYLRVRRENGVRYLDYVSSFDQPCSQEINFGVNLVDIENKVNAQDVCTVLYPVGKKINGDYTNIAVANDGNEYLEDAEGIEKYGRIVKSYTWGEVTDPVQLKQLAVDYMAKLKAVVTLTITAVDLHACGADVDSIHLGDTVRLHSIPHGLDKYETCSAIELNIEKPEKSEYTFGIPQETLTDSNANTVKHFGAWINDQHRWLTETEDALNITVEKINLIGHRTTQLEIDVDAAEAAITLKASQDDVNILKERHTEVELRLDAAEDAITAQAATITLQGKTIEGKADLILLDGYVKANDLETEILTVVNGANVDSMSVNTLAGGSCDFDELWCGQLNGKSPSWKGVEVVTGGSVTVTRTLSPYFYDSAGNLTTISYVTDATFVPKTSYITYLGGA